jgi:hypothetical protein
MKIGRTPLNSSSECFCVYSHSAAEPCFAFTVMNGSSNTSVLV